MKMPPCRKLPRRAVPVAVLSALIVAWPAIIARSAPAPETPPAAQATAPAKPATQPAVAAPSDVVLQRIRSIRIPSVQFSDAGLDGVLLTLTELSADFSPTRQGVKFVVLPGPDKVRPNPAVTLSLHNLTLAEILAAICRQHNMTWEVAPGLVYLMPQGVSVPREYMETRTFGTTRATIIRIAPEALLTPSSL